MLNEFAIRNTEFNKNNAKNDRIINKLKEIGNDSVFYFGIFLLAFFLLNSIPFMSGLFSEINIGINEVIVSSIGLVNVFFYKIYKNIFSKIS